MGTWVNWPSLDFVVAAVVVLSDIVMHALNLHPLESHLDASGRVTWLQTLAGVSGALLGLEITAVSIFYAVSPGRRLSAAISDVGTGLTRLFMSCIVMLAVCTALVALAMPLYGSHPLKDVGLILLAVIAMILLRTGRLMWLIHRLLTVFAADAVDQAQQPITSGWTRPVITEDDYQVAARRSPSGPD